MAPAQLDVMVAGWRCVQRRWRMPTVDNTAACSRRSDPPLPFSCRRAFTFQFPVSSFQFPVSTSQAQPHFHQVPVSSFQFPISSFQSLLSRIPNALSNSYVREASRAFKKVEIDRGAEGPISSFQNLGTRLVFGELKTLDSAQTDCTTLQKVYQTHPKRLR